MTLNPLEEFVIARQLNDPNDAGTYYVRAVVRNAKTDELIATLNLDNKGSQRFTKTWQVPQDPTGLGFYITITTLVYINSGYSTLSTTYGSEQHEFLIQDRLNPYLRGGGGADINYKRIREIVQEEIGKLPKTEIPQPEQFDYETLAQGFESVLNAVTGIKLPETDLRPVVSQLEALGEEIKAIEMPQTNLEPVISRLDELQLLLEDRTEQLQDGSKALLAQSGSESVARLKKVEVLITAIKEQLENIQFVVFPSNQPEKSKKKKSDEILNEYLND